MPSATPSAVRDRVPVESLTPRQREVLGLLARGHTNAEIGEKLGISLDGAKWHVSEIITRLGVDSREEAADWWRAQQGLRTRLARLAAGFSLPHVSWLKATVAAGGMAAVAGAAVVAVLLANGGGDTQAPAAGETPGATATPAAGLPRIVSCFPRIDSAGCDFAAQAEDWVRDRDLAALTGRGSAWDNDNDRKSLGETLDRLAAQGGGNPLRLVTIACPAAVGTPPDVDCTKAIGLSFTTLTDEELQARDPGKSGTPAVGTTDEVLVLGFDRQSPAGPRLASVALADGESRLLALRGGTATEAAVGCTNFTGYPVQAEANCMPSAFYPARVTRDPLPGTTPTPSGAKLAFCPPEVGQPVCDFAAQAEATVKADGLGALFPAGASVPSFNPPGTPRLASIGCAATADGVSRPVASCDRTFYLAFATVTTEEINGQAGGVVIVQFGITAAKGMFYESFILPAGPDILAALTGYETTGCSGGVAGGMPDCIQFYAVETLGPGQAPFDPNAVERIGGVDVQPFTVGADAKLPQNLSVFYTVIGYATDGGSPDIWRAYTAADGTLVREPLWTAEKNPIGAGAALATFAIDERGGEIVAAACLKPGTCFATGLGGGPAPGSAELEVFRSKDGGIFWQDEGRTVPVGTNFIGFTPNGVLMSSWDGESQFHYYPSGAKVTPPEDGYYPHVAPGIGVVWEPNNPGKGVTYDATGKVIYRHQFIPDGASNTRESVTGRDADGNLLVTWMYVPTHPADPRPFTTYVAKVDPVGKVLAVQSWAQTETLRQPWPLTADVAIGNVLLSRTNADRLFEFEAALFDLKTDAVLPLRGLSAGLTGNQHPFLRAVVAGPTFTVTGAGDCLNVRAESVADAEVLGCFRDGVLLGDRQAERTAGGITWRAVATPDGRPGWASAEFLR